MPTCASSVCKIIAAAILGICALGAILWVFFWRVNSIPDGTPVSAPHAYRRPGTDISIVNLAVFYAVPQDARAEIDVDWKEKLMPILNQAARFHHLQFRGTSKILYVLYPEPLILEHARIFYDTASTDGGNPEALKSITSEIQQRAGEFISSLPAGFRSLGIIYEGVGASGTEGAFILSRTFVTGPQYLHSRASLLYHEFGHTLGLPDQYSLTTGDSGRIDEAYSDDIMGAGRNHPIEEAYLDRTLLRDMGVISAGTDIQLP